MDLRYLKAARERRARYYTEGRAILAAVRAAGRMELTVAEQARIEALLEAMESETMRIHEFEGASHEPSRPAAHRFATPRPISEHKRELAAAEDALNRRGERPTKHADRWSAAVHEAGHAVACLALGERVEWASVEPGMTSFGAGADEVVAFAGTAACHFAGLDDAPSPSDLALARSAVSTQPGGDRRLPAAMAEARALVASCWPAVHAVAGELFLRGTMTGEEIQGVARAATWRARAAKRQPQYGRSGWCALPGLGATVGAR